MARLFRSLEDLPESFKSGAVAVGNFDGVHRGHQRLIEELVSLAGLVNGPSVVLTFDPPPVAILVPDSLPSAPLTSLSRRAELLGSLGVDALIAYPTDRTLLNLGPNEFFAQKILVELGAKAMVEGPNFRFGKDRLGDTSLLKTLCDQEKMTLRIVEAKDDAAGEMISSSRIRKALAAGEIDSANAMLTQPYQISGVVSKGAQRGREIGFPTANLADLCSLVPAYGVYAGQVTLEGRRIVAAVHIGPNPTFGERRPKVEIHLLDWEGTIYGERLTVQLVHRIRDVKKFDSVDELVSQLDEDVQQCATLLEVDPS